MALPPYLTPDSEGPAGEKSEPSMRRGWRLVAVMVVVAAVSAIVGALVTRVETDDRASSTVKSSTPKNSTAGRFSLTGQAVTVGGWRIVVDDYHVADDVDGLRAHEGSRWLVAFLTITNTEGRPREFFAPDQIELIFLTSALEKSPVFPPRGTGCASGYCERGPEFGGDTHPVGSGRTVHWHFAFRIPDDANGFRLVLRPSYSDLTDARQAQMINLSCC